MPGEKNAHRAVYYIIKCGSQPDGNMYIIVINYRHHIWRASTLVAVRRRAYTFSIVVLMPCRFRGVQISHCQNALVSDKTSGKSIPFIG